MIDPFRLHDDKDADRLAEVALMAVLDEQLVQPVTAGTILQAWNILDAAFLRVCVEGGIPATEVERIRGAGGLLSGKFYERMELHEAAQRLREHGAEHADLEAVAAAQSSCAILDALEDVKAGWKPG